MPHCSRRAVQPMFRVQNKHDVKSTSELRVWFILNLFNTKVAETGKILYLLSEQA